jgi:hypothetical protein
MAEDHCTTVTFAKAKRGWIERGKPFKALDCSLVAADGVFCSGHGR